jgi:hypothetical protein
MLATFQIVKKGTWHTTERQFLKKSEYHQISGSALATASNSGGGTALPITLYFIPKLLLSVSGKINSLEKPCNLAASR